MTRKPELGVYLEQTRPFVEVVKAISVEDFKLINPELALPRRDRVVVYIANHGSFIAPFPAGVLTAEYLLDRGGYEDFIVVSLFHEVAEYIPGLSPLLVRYFGHSTQQLRSLPELIEKMKARAFHIIGTTPEARSVVFSWREPIGPFTKVGLMVAALEADADIVLIAQRGNEVFGQPIRLPFDLSLPIHGRPQGLLLPRWYPGLRARVAVAYRRHAPLTSFDERAAMSPADRREQIDREIGWIREQLTDLYRSVPERW